MKKFITSNIFIIIFVLLFSFITIGYALYSETINLNGNVTVQKAGIIEITSASIVRDECSNLTSYNEPTYNKMHIDFVITSGSTNFSATYLITVTNNSNRDYTYTGFPVNAKIEGYDYVPNVTATVTRADNGNIVEAGEPIKSKESITIKLKLDFSIDRNQGGLTINVSGDITASEDNSGSINASITPNNGDLRGKGTLAEFTLNVINTFSYRRVINLSSSNENIMVVDSNGNHLSTVTIDANSTDSYQIYLKVKEGSVFLTDTTTTNIILSSNGILDINTGTLTLNVDVDILSTDDDKVEVGNVSLAISEVNPIEGEAIVTFNRLDSGGSSVVNYYIILRNEDTGVETTYETGNAITNYTISNLSPGNYSVKVYGLDEAGNSGVNDCSNAISSGYCAISNTTHLQWIFNVTTNLSRLTFDGNDTALIYSNYEGTLAVSGWGAYSLPDSITVTMNGNNLTSGTDYTYDSSSGRVVINKVTGDINITASAGSSVCLIEGTKVRLSDGSYKNVEDIDYDDLLMVYDHENGGVTYEYPIWIEKSKKTSSYQRTTFSDGTYIETYGPHSLFDADSSKYVLVTDKENFHIGTRVVKINNEGKIETVTVTKIEHIKSIKNYYHVSSTRYHNIIANDFLTTDGTVFSNFLYTFNKDVTWGEDREEYLNTNDFFPYEFLAPYFPEYLFYGYRMEEAKNVYNKGLLDINSFANILVLSNTKPVIKDSDNTNLWMVTTSDDVVTNENKESFLYKEKSYYTLKEPKNKENFIGWLNTGDNKIYQAGDKVKVIYGTHFIAKYKDV